jgi:hypothetical protein
MTTEQTQHGLIHEYDDYDDDDDDDDHDHDHDDYG